MSKYHRAKREELKEPSIKKLSFRLGCERDSFEKLGVLCNDKCIDLLKNEDFKDYEKMEVAFWTDDCVDLIGVATFTRNESGEPIFSLDYSMGTV